MASHGITEYVYVALLLVTHLDSHRRSASQLQLRGSGSHFIVMTINGTASFSDFLRSVNSLRTRLRYSKLLISSSWSHVIVDVCSTPLDPIMSKSTKVRLGLGLGLGYQGVGPRNKGSSKASKPLMATLDITHFSSSLSSQWPSPRCIQQPFHSRALTCRLS